MHRLACLLALLGVFALPLRATTLEEDVSAADTKRVLSTLRSDADRLSTLLSDGLTYGHVDGRVQTKEVFLAAVRTNRIKYEAYDYQEKKITRVSDDLALITGRARLKASAGVQHVDFSIRFLAVWRREDGVWRLFAYQSAKLDEPVAAPAAK